MEAQWSMGKLLLELEGGAGTPLGAAGISEQKQADVGLELCTDTFPGAHPTEMRRYGHLRTTNRCVCGCQPWAEEGMALLEKAARQGHAYAMCELGCIHLKRKEHERAAEWWTKGAEAGLPNAMWMLACCLDFGKGEAAPDYPAAADWYRRAFDAGGGPSGAVGAANTLYTMYTVGRGMAWQTIPATPSSTFRILFLESNGIASRCEQYLQPDPSAWRRA